MAKGNRVAKVAASRSIVKDLNPEEKAMFDNIKSIIAQMEGAEAAEGEEDQSMKAIEGMAQALPNEEETAEPLPNMMQDTEDGQPETPLPKKPPVAMASKRPFAMKSNRGQGEATAEDGTTVGNDDVEERIEEGPSDQDDDNINEVKRALSTLAKSILGRRGVQKSGSEDASTIVVKALQQISDRQDQMQMAMEGLFKNLGIADQIVAAAAPTVTKSAEGRSRPVGNLDTDAVAQMVLKSLVEAAGKNRGVVGADVGREDVRKDLSSVMTSLFHGTQR